MLTGRHYLTRVLLLIPLILIVLWGWRGFPGLNILPVKQVKVESAYQYVSRDSLKSTILPYLNDGLPFVDISRLRQQLLQLPLIADVAVFRIWPDTVRIRLIEQDVIARWGDGAVLNRDGEVLVPLMGAVPSDLPLMLGSAQQQQQILQMYQELSQLLMPLKLTIARLELSDRESWTLELNNGMKLILGTADPVAGVARFVVAYDDVFAAKANTAEQIDLRYHDGMAVRWQDTG